MAVNSTRQHGIPACNLAALNTSKFYAQNGRVERVHLTILNGVRTVLAHSGLGAQFWAELHIAYTRRPQHLVPDDSWQNKESRLDHLQHLAVKSSIASKLALATKKVFLWDTWTALTSTSVKPTAIKS